MLSKNFRFIIKGLVATAASVFIAGSAQAITDGGPDNNEHPYVGLAVFYDAAGNPAWRCSGTMMSPTVFLTAGHCTFGAASANIWFEEDVDSGRPANGYPFGGGTSVHGSQVVSHPNYYDPAFFLYDVGIVVLDQPVNMPQYGALPTEKILDDWMKRRGKQDTTVTAVGYGLQRIISDVFVTGDRVRLKAELGLINLNGLGATLPPNTSIGLTNNAATGGTCFGDSGGPNFLNDTNIVVSVTSFGLNGNCAGTGWGYRIDQPDDKAFLESYGLTYP